MWKLAGVSFCVLLASTVLVAGSAPGSAAAVEKSAARVSSGTSDRGRFGLAVKTSLLGVGAETAARVTHRGNIRAGFNVMGYSRSFDKDGVSYHGHLRMRTFEAHYDFFPWARSFHISPGVLAFLGDPITANALVPGNQSITFGGASYSSDPANPLRISGKGNFNRAAPMITVGFGNLVHRDSKRFSIPFEVGVAFQGAPKTSLNLAGNICDSPGTNCRSVADPTVQQNVVAEQNKINNDIRAFKVYPIISLGFGYKF